MAEGKGPAESKRSFAESLLRGDSVAASGSEARKGYSTQWQPTAQALYLRVWFKDGRRAEGLPWAFYSGDGWNAGTSGKPECLVLIFGERVVTIEGYHLRRLIEQIDEGRLKSIREQDSQEIALMRSESGDGIALITRVDVQPELEEIAGRTRKGES